MSALAITTAAAAFVLGLRPPAPPPMMAPVARDAPSAGAALATWLADASGVVAFGEVHEDAATVGTRSTLARFTDDILPALAPRASHLIVETWVTTGACGAAEARVTDDVARTTERPAETGSEIVRLLRRAKESGVAPHVLSVSCAEYASLSQNAGRVDYDRLLALTERHLERAIRQAVMLPRGPGRPLVLVYGGALHNDLRPRRALAAYAFGPAIFALMHGDYRQVDLYVPELVERLAALRAEPWFAAWRAHARPTATVVIPRSARATIVVLPAGVRAQK
ncbi:MAG TPA: hypothetical protein VLA14_18855 [Polyangia bacterium]|nr:hypothetical protein [Polyangia bacterium]